MKMNTLKNLTTNLILGLTLSLLSTTSLADVATGTYSQIKNHDTYRDHQGNGEFHVDVFKSSDLLAFNVNFSHQGHRFPHMLQFKFQHQDALRDLRSGGSADGHPYLVAVDESEFMSPTKRTRFFVEFHSSKPGYIRLTIQTNVDPSQPTGGRFTAEHARADAQKKIYIVTSGWIKVD